MDIVVTTYCPAPTVAQIVITGILLKLGYSPSYTPGDMRVKAHKELTEDAKNEILKQYPKARFSR
jgi:hypothetical protein